MSWKSHLLNHLSHVLSPIPWPTQNRKNASNTISYPTTASTRLLQEHTSKTMSRKRTSISLIHKKSLDFIWPCRLLTDTSQEMLWRLLLNFRIGTLALGILCISHHPSADQQCHEMKNYETKKNDVKTFKT